MTRPEDYSLPQTGFVRQKQLMTLLPYSSSTLWKHIKCGKFPAPVKLSAGVTAWSVEAVRAWLKVNGCDPDSEATSATLQGNVPAAIVKPGNSVAPRPPSAKPKTKPRLSGAIDRVWEAQLAKEAAVWREAENIRAYVAAVIGRAVASGQPISDELTAWAAAASEAANRKDPLPDRMAKLAALAFPKG